MTTELSRRNLVALGLSGIAVAALAGCSSSSGGDTASLDGKTKGAMKALGVDQQFRATTALTFSMLFQDNPAYPLKKTWQIFDEILKRTDVTLDPTVVPYADYQQKRSLLINSGNAPTILAKTYAGEESQFVGGGAIVAASDWTKYMPNFTDKVKRWKMTPDIAGILQADGKYYVFPGMNENIFLDYTLAARMDVLEDDGLEVPQTWDQVRSVLAALKKNHPEAEYPLSDRFMGGSLLNYAAQSWGTMAGPNWGIGNGLMFDQAKKKFFFAPASAEFKDLLQFFSGLVKDGLLDPESFTQTDDQAQAKFVTGKSFMISTNAQAVSIYRQAADKSLGKGKYRIAKLPIPAGPLGKRVAGTRLENGFMISSKAVDSPNFKALLQFVDWLWYSDEAQKMSKWGVEGTTFTEQGAKYTLKPGYSLQAYGFDPAGAKTDIRLDLGYSCGNFMYGGTTQILQSTMDAEELAWQKNAATYTRATPSPGVPYTQAQRQKATLQQTALIDTANTATLNFILGKQSFDQWGAYLNQLKSKGVQSYVDDANRYYAAVQKKIS